MFSKIFLGLVLTTAFVPDMYSADVTTVKASLSSAITKRIADEMKGKSEGFKLVAEGFSVEKLPDPTDPNGALLEDTRSKIDAVLTAEEYPNSGDYIELIEQEGLNGVYRVVSFTFNKDATNIEDKITNVAEIALVEIKKSDAEEHHSVPQPVVAEPAAPVGQVQAAVVAPVSADPRVHAEDNHIHQAAPAPVEQVQAAVEPAHAVVAQEAYAYAYGNAAAHMGGVVSNPSAVEPRVHAEDNHIHQTAPAPVEQVQAAVEPAHAVAVQEAYAYAYGNAAGHMGGVVSNPSAVEPAHAVVAQEAYSYAYGNAAAHMEGVVSNSLAVEPRVHAEDNHIHQTAVASEQPKQKTARSKKK